jgi:hypothetical protein
MAQKSIAKKSVSAPKSTVKKRSLNPSGKGRMVRGAPMTEQDAKRRLGNFEGAGEHARVGGRTTGIVGQTKQKNKTDKRK